MPSRGIQLIGTAAIALGGRTAPVAKPQGATPRLLLPLLLFLSGACQQARAKDDGWVIHFGTSDGISDPEKGPESSVTANLAELIYRTAAPAVTEKARGPDWLLLVPSDDRIEASWVAKHLRHHKLRNIEVKEGAVLARFTGQAPAPHDLMLQDGPFEVVEFEKNDRLVLRRRSPATSPTRLVVHNASSEDELWRWLLSGQVDVIPVSSSARLRNVGQLPSVRVVNFEWPQQVSLFLNVQRPGLDDPALRHAIASALDRTAIATAGAGRELDLRGGGNTEALQGSVLQKRVLRVVAYRRDASMLRALDVVCGGLSQHGIQCDRLIEDVDGMVAVVKEGSFDAVLFFRSSEERLLTQFHSSSPYNVLTRFSSAPFDDAIDHGDLAKARSILEQEMPFIPLYEVDLRFAVDAQLCNAHPRLGYDLSWLADLRPCRAGERE